MVIRSDPGSHGLGPLIVPGGDMDSPVASDVGVACATLEGIEILEQETLGQLQLDSAGGAERAVVGLTDLARHGKR
jgi:hypothetical protein